MTRRLFVSASTAALAAASTRLPVKKAVLLSIGPRALRMMALCVSSDRVSSTQVAIEVGRETPMLVRGI